uniref:WGR domain-containing protein n=1 Tax=Leptobrachium leishanense TaxID=445787 RepID=A0A8C5Q1K5_9ANUR
MPPKTQSTGNGKEAEVKEEPIQAPKASSGTKGKAKVKNEVKEEPIQAPKASSGTKGKAKVKEEPIQAPKASSGTKGKAKVKNEIKEEPIQAPDHFESTKQALASGKKGKTKVDSACPLNKQGNCEDYDCMLNQTNIGHNNNKFYIIQLLSDSDNFYCWNRWGRVGEVGQSKLNSFNDPEPAIKDFEKKFRDKTKNAWSDREKFTPHPGKYTLIEVAHDDEEDGGAGEVAIKVSHWTHTQLT